MVLTGRLVALAAVAVVLAALSGTAALLWAGLLVLAVLADLSLAARIASLRFAREDVPAVRLGGTTTTELTVTNTGRRALRGPVRDAWVPSAGAAPRAQRVHVPPGERRVVRTSLTPTRRGRRAAVVVVVRAAGPLGLAARQRRVAVPGVLAVLPPFTAKRFLPEKLARLRRLDGAVLLRRRGAGSEFDSLRPWVDGDDVRSVDWRATARADEVVVRTWRPERDRHVVLALDTGRASAARLGGTADGLGDGTRLDAALDAALLLGALCARAGDRVALVAADVAVRARLGLAGGREVLPRLTAALAPLEPELVETDPDLLAAQVLRQVPKRSLVVLFASLDTGAETGLLPAVEALAARHEVVVASVSDPALDDLAQRRANSLDVYTAAAAELVAEARDSLVEGLTRRGVHVVAAPADVFASRVADAYLDLKAAGRL